MFHFTATRAARRDRAHILRDLTISEMSLFHAIRGGSRQVSSDPRVQKYGIIHILPRIRHDACRAGINRAYGVHHGYVVPIIVKCTYDRYQTRESCMVPSTERAVDEIEGKIASANFPFNLQHLQMTPPYHFPTGILPACAHSLTRFRWIV